MFEINVITNKITTIQGESGTFQINGLPVDKNYYIYFGIIDGKTNKVISQTETVRTNRLSSVIIPITKTFTNAMSVQSGRESATYLWGVKLCDEEGMSETLQIGSIPATTDYEIEVFRKKVEGLNG